MRGIDHRLGDDPMFRCSVGRMLTRCRIHTICPTYPFQCISPRPAMKIRWSFSGCSHDQRTRIEEAWRDSRPGLEARIGEFDPRAVDVVFSVSYNHARRLPWRIQGRVELATKPYVADVQFSDPQIAIDECVGQIADQLACETAHSF
jgi:hypothetical protein